METRGRELGLRFIELDGDVGVLANGAGLTMTTMDVVRHYGGEPANFLEIGGEAYTLGKPALELVLSNPNVKCLLVNFCGAFARTDVLGLAVDTSGFLVALNLAWLPLFWRLADRAGISADRREWIGEALWLCAGLGLVVTTTRFLGPETAMLVAYGPLIVMKFIVDEIVIVWENDDAAASNLLIGPWNAAAATAVLVVVSFVSCVCCCVDCYIGKCREPSVSSSSLDAFPQAIESSQSGPREGQSSVGIPPILQRHRLVVIALADHPSVRDARRSLRNDSQSASIHERREACTRLESQSS